MLVYRSKYLMTNYTLEKLYTACSVVRAVPIYNIIFLTVDDARFTFQRTMKSKPEAVWLFIFVSPFTRCIGTPCRLCMHAAAAAVYILLNCYVPTFVIIADEIRQGGCGRRRVVYTYF